MVLSTVFRIDLGKTPAATSLVLPVDPALPAASIGASLSRVALLQVIGRLERREVYNVIRTLAALTGIGVWTAEVLLNPFAYAPERDKLR